MRVLAVFLFGGMRGICMEKRKSVETWQNVGVKWLNKGKQRRSQENELREEL